MELHDRINNIKWIIFDVDGVLTDGSIIIGNSGELCKVFNAQDGLGISLLRAAGIGTAIITGRVSQIVAERARELQIDEVYQGSHNKAKTFADFCSKYKLDAQEVAYVGDDLIDLPIMCQAGLACAVGNAVTEVKANAHLTAKCCGGHGAVREIAEIILKQQGKWEDILAGFLTKNPPKNTVQ